MHKQIIAIAFPDPERGWIEDELEVEDAVFKKLLQPQEFEAQEKE